MIRKDQIDNCYSINPHSIVTEILADNHEYYMTKEELYELLPKLGDERVITFGQMNTALKDLCRFGHGKCIYIKGRAYYSYKHECDNGKRYYYLDDRKAAS
jgi:hypothetical protein